MDEKYCPHYWTVLERNISINDKETTKTIIKQCIKCGAIKTEKEE